MPGGGGGKERKKIVGPNGRIAGKRGKNPTIISRGTSYNPPKEKKEFLRSKGEA